MFNLTLSGKLRLLITKQNSKAKNIDIAENFSHL